jgi:hypothetical protein
MNPMDETPKVAIEEIESNYMQSLKGEFNQADLEKWGHNLVVFLTPVFVIYLASIAGRLGTGFSLSDFVPNGLDVGAMALYVVNAGLDFFRKVQAGPTPTQSTQ